MSAGVPGDENYIENCTAGTEMAKCFKEQLGYDMLYKGDNMTTAELNSILNIVRQGLKSYRRVVFYYFGHGDAQSIQTADGLIRRSDIVSAFENVDANIQKIIIFECCRLGTNLQQYRTPPNTIVIDAADFNDEAHYKKGIGYFAKKFASFAPKRSIPLTELIVEVRNAVISETAFDLLDKQQILVDTGTLTETLNLLAQSQGTGRCILYKNDWN